MIKAQVARDLDSEYNKQKQNRREKFRFVQWQSLEYNEKGFISKFVIGALVAPVSDGGNLISAETSDSCNPLRDLKLRVL